MNLEPRQFSPCFTARRPMAKTARILSSTGIALRTCKVASLSPSGATLRLPDPAAAGRRFSLLIDGEAAPRQCEYAWSSPSELGVSFVRAAALGNTPRCGTDLVWR